MNICAYGYVRKVKIKLSFFLNKKTFKFIYESIFKYLDVSLQRQINLERIDDPSNFVNESIKYLGNFSNMLIKQ